MGGNPGEPSFPSPGHTRGYEINQAQSFDRTAGGMTAEQLVSGVAACVGRWCWRREEDVGQGHPLAGAWGSLFGGDALYITRGCMLAPGCGSWWSDAEYVYGMGVRVRVCAPGEACRRLSQ